MADVIKKYTVEEPSDVPVFLIFINDGGCKAGIKNSLWNPQRNQYSGNLWASAILILMYYVS